MSKFPGETRRWSRLFRDALRAGQAAGIAAANATSAERVLLDRQKERAKTIVPAPVAPKTPETGATIRDEVVLPASFKDALFAYADAEFTVGHHLGAGKLVSTIEPCRQRRDAALVNLVAVLNGAARAAPRPVEAADGDDLPSAIRDAINAYGAMSSIHGGDIEAGKPLAARTDAAVDVGTARKKLEEAIWAVIAPEDIPMFHVVHFRSTGVGLTVNAENMDAIDLARTGGYARVRFTR